MLNTFPYGLKFEFAIADCQYYNPSVWGGLFRELVIKFHPLSHQDWRNEWSYFLTQTKYIFFYFGVSYIQMERWDCARKNVAVSTTYWRGVKNLPPMILSKNGLATGMRWIPSSRTLIRGIQVDRLA